MRLLTLGLAAFLLLGDPQALPAQDTPCSIQTVFASVLEEGGSPVSGLTAANFRAKIRGKTVEILSAESDTGPRRMVLAVDLSGSTTSSPGMGVAVQVLASDFYHFAPQHGQVAQVIFSTEVLVRQHFNDPRSPQDFSREWNEARQRVQSRKTALYDAIREALAEFHSPRQGDVIYVISDGGDNFSKTSLQELRDTLMTAKVRLFASILEKKNSRIVEELAGASGLIDLAKATGGDFVCLFPEEYVQDYWNSAEVHVSDRLTVARMCREMLVGYNLSIKLPLSVRKPQNWKLWVATENGALKRNFRVHYPQKLMPCTSDFKQH